ncbi:MAG: RNA 2',3'-cyclic phosphodiesterase [Spirochaetales bacterium]|nr:RNA 2',3'-cyclic phosphodiesterase [Spirochaetales bacterium]
MEFFRLFTAVLPPSPTLAAIEKIRDELRERIDPGSIRWTARGNMHVTLQFLGDTAKDRVQEVIAAMTGGVSRAAKQPEIDLTVGGVGAFPSAQRPRVVWIGVQDVSGGLAHVQRAIGRRLRESGFQLDNKPFRPHITLGYVRRRATQGAIRAIAEVVRGSHSGTEDDPAGHAAGRVPTKFTASDLLLVRSTLSPSGAIYSVVHSVPLSSASDKISSGESARE